MVHNIITSAQIPRKGHKAAYLPIFEIEKKIINSLKILYIDK